MMLPRKATSRKNQTEVRFSGRSRSSFSFCSAAMSIHLDLAQEIGPLRQRSHIFEQFRSARGTREPRDLAFRIVQVPEYQCRGWTGLNAGRLDLAVLQRP